MWEVNDLIWGGKTVTARVKSSTSDITKTQPRAKFMVYGEYKNPTYNVYYTGANTTNGLDVNIATQQTQEKPNDTKHFGTSGDCGAAITHKVGNQFEFELKHKASYLCFLPRITNAALASNVFLTKIVVKSNHNIAGKYGLYLDGLKGESNAKEITLTTKGSGQVPGPWDTGSTKNQTSVTAPGFPISSYTDVANAAYMVIAPGKHTLTIDYHIEDPVTKVKGIITKTLAANDFRANMVYDISANLTLKDYSANYYMWNALEATWTEKSHLFIPYGPAISGQYPLIGTNR